MSGPKTLRSFMRGIENPNAMSSRYLPWGNRRRRPTRRLAKKGDWSPDYAIGHIALSDRDVLTSFGAARAPHPVGAGRKAG